jgi:hypothetical protein
VKKVLRQKSHFLYLRPVLTMKILERLVQRQILFQAHQWPDASVETLLAVGLVSLVLVEKLPPA